MPTYEYQCKDCGHTFEAFQSMSEDPLKDCPKCGREIRRIINGGGGVIFKGSGFYVTDAKKSGAASAKQDGKAGGKGPPGETAAAGGKGPGAETAAAEKGPAAEKSPGDGKTAAGTPGASAPGSEKAAG
ncbi:MAG: zinc ribbon domain-containing protein [Spirochaetaceae bacterium]|jgi:putative FmdB family regulatory protein|nr:zinc ribbon domain-containing protein [Spirochaetaceae bacterium]